MATTCSTASWIAFVASPVRSCGITSQTLVPIDLVSRFSYSFGGAKLVVSKRSIPLPHMHASCEACGGPRVFECQLLPSFVSMLHVHGDSSVRPINFGSIELYACAKSCWAGGIVEEFALVQPDPDDDIRL